MLHCDRNVLELNPLKSGNKNDSVRVDFTVFRVEFHSKTKNEECISIPVHSENKCILIFTVVAKELAI